MSKKAKRRTRVSRWLTQGPLPIPGVVQIVYEYDNGFEGNLSLQVAGRNPTRCMTVLSDGKFASGRYDGTIDILDRASGVPQHTLRKHLGSVSILIALPGVQLVSGSSVQYSAEMCLWNAATGECLRTFGGHERGVQAVAVLPDGALASSSCAPIIRVWDSLSGELLRPLEGHTACVSFLMTLENGKLVSASDDKTVRVWNPLCGQCELVLEGHLKAVTCVAVMLDGKLASSSLDTTVRIWQTNGVCLRVLAGHQWGVWGLAVMPDGELVSAGNDHSAVVWDSEGVRLRTLQGHEDIMYEMVVMPDGKLVSASRDSTVRVWDIKTGHFIQILQFDNDTSNDYPHSAGCRLQVLPDGQLAGIWFNGSLCIWE